MYLTFDVSYEETCKAYKNFVFISLMFLIDYWKLELTRLMAIGNRCIISDRVLQKHCARSLTF